MMKKYLLITALCAANLAYADGFENLKNLQNQFHVLIYNAGDLGAATPAPEVPYIAGLLTNPVESIGAGEERHIYEFLYDQPSGRNRKAIPDIDQAKVDAFNTINFTNFQRYRSYQDSGHSVFGIAAQEQLPPIEKVTIMSAVPRASPIVVNSSSSSSNAPTGPGLFAGGGGSFELPKLRRATTNASSTSVSATAPKSLLEKVREHKKTLRNQVDIELLTELENELSRGASEASLASDRYNSLVEFFNLLTTKGPGLKDVRAQRELDNNIKTLRDRLRPKEIKNDTASPAPIVAIGGLSIDPGHVNNFISKASSLDSAKKAASSGNTEVDTLSKVLENLKERKEELDQDGSDEDWDDEDTKPKKSAQELEREQEELKEINAQILEKAEALAIHPEGRLDLILDEMDEKNAIYQRIYNHLKDSTNRSKNQDDVYQQITAKLRSLNGGMKVRQSAVGVGSNSATTNVPAVAVGNIDSQSVQNHIVGLTQIPDTQADDSYQKDRYLSAINEYLQGLIVRGAEGAEDRKAYLNRLHDVLEGIETNSIATKKRAHVSTALGTLKAAIKKELASQK